jgi:hypothetical protein
MGNGMIRVAQRRGPAGPGWGCAVFVAHGPTRAGAIRKCVEQRGAGIGIVHSDHEDPAAGALHPQPRAGMRHDADSSALAYAPAPAAEKTREHWIAALVGHPTFAQRPIMTADDGRAVSARTEDAVWSVL